MDATPSRGAGAEEPGCENTAARMRPLAQRPSRADIAAGSERRGEAQARAAPQRRTTPALMRDLTLTLVVLALLLVRPVEGTCKAWCTISADGVAAEQYTDNGATTDVKICLLEATLPDWSNGVNDDSWRMAAYTQLCAAETTQGGGWGAAGCGGTRAFHCDDLVGSPDHCVAIPGARGCNPTAGIAVVTGWVSFVTLQENGGSDAYLFGAMGTEALGSYRPVCAKHEAAGATPMCQPMCPPGKWSSDGYVASVAPQTTCADCAVGQYSDMFAQVCTDCVGGTADTDLNAGTPCEVCVPGTYSGNVATSCMPCAPGQYDQDSLTTTPCIDCPLGRYHVSATQCDACPTNTVTRSPGTLSVAGCLCDVGYTGTLNFPGQMCTQCPTMTYKARLGPAVCVSCPPNSGSAGYGSNGFNSKSLCLCDPGYQGTLVDGGATNCEPCPLDTYKESSGAGPCGACEANSGTFQRTGAKLQPECMCGPGFYPSVAGNMAGSSNCTACRKDRFKELYGISH